MNAAPGHSSRLSWRRLRALTVKETRQLVRDKSNLLVGLFLPLMLILIFGYGLSFDIRDAPVALVMEDSSPTAHDVVAGFYLSPYFSPISLASMTEAQQLMRNRKIDAIVYLRSDFTRRLAAGNATVQVLVNGVDANRGRALQAFAQGAIAQWAVKRAAAGESAALPTPALRVETRMWFNEANDSRHFIVPGLIVLIMTLNGALLTSLVIAREWERGTLESLFVTPVHATEIVISKIIPYFFVGLFGLTMCLLSARFLFDVPTQGSLVLIVIFSMLYLLFSLGLGLFISAATKNQFLASQVALIVSFLPAMMLSGFIFDLRSMPVFVRSISRVLPPTYYVEALQTLFLAGNVATLLARDFAILATAATAFLLLTRFKTRKELE